ncbi:HutD family protein [Sulfitobacter sp. PS-8MA]|uniref:HutD family protein n=1 Tax=Sulfitobacter sp. PS-8MA TaxID=3237707 RepID=UPI0034C5F949
MYQIILPHAFTSSRWKNGGGVVHEIIRDNVNDPWQWRISLADVTSDGPFSLFEGMTRILTVVDGNGLNLLTPECELAARRFQPVEFAGDIPVESRMVSGGVRNLNVIYSPAKMIASVVVLAGPKVIPAGPGQTGLFCLAGPIEADGQTVPTGAFALGNGGNICLPRRTHAAILKLTERRS